MKLTTFILLIMLLQASAATFGQKVSIKQRNATLESVLEQIGSQAGYGIVYDAKAIKASQKIDIAVDNVSAEEAITSALTGLDLRFEVNDKIITISKAKTNTLPGQNKNARTAFEARGTVLDEQGRPIPGATVKLKTGKGATITDEKGRFELPNCNTGEIIVITFIGYNAKELPAAADIGTIKLDPATSKLDEVVVQAYGKTSQRLSTGNISSITAKQIENKPISNPLLALQGEVPGIVVSQASGNANSGIQIQLQGMNSMGQGNDPFFVVDGVPYISQLPLNLNSRAGQSTPLPLASGTIGASFGNPLSFINPTDIESISVLKGADATSIYGARAANGAILITTKKGKVGDANVTLNIQQGVSGYKKIKMLDRDAYLQMRRDAYYGTDGLTNNSPEFATQYDLNGTWDASRYTNWQDELLGHSSYSDANISLSGGTINDQYLISSSYHHEGSIIKLLDLGNKKFSMHVNLNHTSPDQKLKVQFNANYQRDVSNLPYVDAVNALKLSPVGPSLFDTDGTINWAPDKNGNSTWKTPFSSIFNNKVSSTSDNILSNLILSYVIFKGLTVQSSFGFSNLRQNEFQLNYITDSAPEFRSFAKGSNVFNNSNYNLWNAEPKLVYNAVLFKGKIEAILGGTYQYSNLDQKLINGSGYDTDILLQSITAAKALSGQAIKYQYRVASLYGRLNYNFGDRYITNFSIRRDGSSRFGANNQFHNFWSMGGAWLFGNENLIKESLNWLSSGKIRASYGTTGSDNIPNYSYLDLYDPISINNPFQNIGSLQSSGLPNPNLQWEETTKFDLGFDIGILNDRITLSTNYYRNRSSNQLLKYALPDVTGFNGYTANFPATVQNSGFEFVASTQNIKTSRFSWTTNLNFTTVANKLIDFPGLSTSAYQNAYVIGQSIALVKLFQYAGVNSTTGLYQFVAADGSLTSKPDGVKDKTVIVDRLTKFSGGFNNNFTFGNFNLGILFQFVKKNANNVATGLNYPGALYSLSGLGNQPAYFTNYWRQPGDQATYQKVSAINSFGDVFSALSAANISTFGISDASYIRLKNVSVSYGIPKKYVGKLKLNSLKLFANIQNVFTITKYKGLDPEFDNFSLPPLKTFVLGLQANF